MPRSHESMTAAGAQRRAEADHPLRREGLWRRAWPFGAALALAFSSLPLIEVSDWALVGVAGALTLAIAASLALVPWTRLPRGLALLPPLLIVVAVFLLREGTGGLADPVDFEALLLLPVLWLALYGTRAQLLAVIALMAASLAASVGLSEGVSEGDWLKAALWPSVAILVGVRAQSLVEEVRLLSRVDPLTGIANRARWEEELGREVARARRSGAGLSVALVDLDHFKQVNDRDGHAAGDRILRASASAWSGALRTSDLIGRWGGEEFGILLPEAALSEAEGVAERVRKATPPGITCSVGVAALGAGEGPQDLLRRADAALYEAKRRGRNRVEIAQP